MSTDNIDHFMETDGVDTEREKNYWSTHWLSL